MSRYFCPYCPSRYQFNKIKSDGSLVCGLCGDKLVKKSFVNLRVIIGAVVATAFLSPLIVMIIFVLSDFTNEKFHKNSQSVVFLDKSI